MLEDVLPHRNHWDRVVGGFLDAIETFNEGEEAVLEGGDVVCRVNPPFVESQQGTQLIIAETTPHHNGSLTAFQSGHQTVVLVFSSSVLYSQMALAYLPISTLHSSEKITNRQLSSLCVPRRRPIVGAYVRS
jgi:hypothetical protein